MPANNIHVEFQGKTYLLSEGAFRQMKEIAATGGAPVAIDYSQKPQVQALISKAVEEATAQTKKKS